jgi:hypothetical protein
LDAIPIDPVLRNPARDLVEALAAEIQKIEASEGSGQILSGLSTLDALLADDPLGEPAPIFKRNGMLPYTIKEAIKFLGLSRLVNKRLAERFFQSALVILVTQEKSGSTMHAVAVRKMLWRTGRLSLVTTMPRQNVISPTTMAGGTVFHAGMLLYFPNGGVCRGVFSPTADNLFHMREVGAKRLVLARHPADRVVAQYCMHLASSQADIQKSLDVVMRIHLPANLEWLAGWVGKRSDPGTHIVRYEDMFDDPRAHFERIHQFLYAEDMSEVLRQDIDEVFAQSGEGGSIRSGNLETRVYAKGYSGTIGVWQNYMTERNIEEYNRVVRDFLKRSPDGDALLELYPNLLLETGVQPAGN